MWDKLFWDTSKDNDSTDVTNLYHLFTADELYGFINSTMSAYYDIDSYTFGNYFLIDG